MLTPEQQAHLDWLAAPIPNSSKSKRPSTAPSRSAASCMRSFAFGRALNSVKPVQKSTRAMRRQCLALIEFEHEAQAVDAIIHDSTSHRRYRGEVGGEVRFVDVAPHNMNEQIGKQLLLSARANR
jgi:hypothetical protein